MRLYVTGFGPFGSVEDNPSAWLAANLGLPFEVLPVTFDAVEDFLARFERDRFDALLSLGVAMGARRMRLEALGRNEIGVSADASGAFRPGPIEEHGPSLRAATLWPLSVVDSTLPRRSVTLSTSAGSYLCNYLLYRSLAALPSHRVGFIHVVSAENLALEHQLRHLKRLLNNLGVS